METGTQSGGNVGIPYLKRLYERYLSRCNELEDPDDHRGGGGDTPDSGVLSEGFFVLLGWCHYFRQQEQQTY